MKIIKQCEYCKRHKVRLKTEHSKFSSYHGKVNLFCDKCRKYHNDYYSKHKEKVRLRRRIYWSLNKDKFKERSFRNHLRRKFSLTIEDYNTLLANQNHKCEICKRDFTDKILPNVDHCHKTGKVRGLLCKKCNFSLRIFELDKDFVQKAKLYLEKSMK